MEILPHDLDQLASLYGDTIYVLPDDAESAASVVVPPVDENLKKELAEAPTVELPKEEKHKQEPRTEPNLETPTQLQIPADRPGITWRPKPSSKVLFVLRTPEFKNPTLTDFLKKIVESLGIPSEQVGFGQIDGPVQLQEFDNIPNPEAVVFDNEIWGGRENPVTLGKAQVFFSLPLEQLHNSQDDKRLLWNHLKGLKDRL